MTALHPGTAGTPGALDGGPLADPALLGPLRPLLGELGDAKRVRVAGRTGSLAEQAFVRSWARLVAGEPTDEVCATEVAAAVAAARLAGVDRHVLRAGGLDDAAATAVLTASYDEVAGPLPAAERWRAALAVPVVPVPDAAALPPSLVALVAQPRAGATAPGRARVVVEPPESHGDHCWTVALYGALLAPAVGADPAEAFLLGLAHHLHNAALPDAGFAGEVLLGEHLEPVLRRFTEAALAELPPALADLVRGLLLARDDAVAPLSQAFHAADVLDRVLQVHHHARAAAFTVSQALDDLELVHDGPVQGFHHRVLAGAGLW